MTKPDTFVTVDAIISHNFLPDALEPGEHLNCFKPSKRDMKIYAESFGANLYHYQDYQGREIDAVVELADGTWCAFEIKLGANQIDGAAENLLRIKQEFAQDPKGKPPAVLCVICGMANAAYQRPDGVFVVPITALKN